MGAWSELQERDRLMAHFIETDPLEITLHRPVETITAAGGRATTGTDTLSPQRFHVYPFKRRLTQENTFNPQTFGEERVEKIIWILIFNRGSDIDENDWFEVPVDAVTDRLQEGRYEVTFLSARLWDRGQAGLIFRG